MKTTQKQITITTAYNSSNKETATTIIIEKIQKHNIFAKLIVVCASRLEYFFISFESLYLIAATNAYLNAHMCALVYVLVYICT